MKIIFNYEKAGKYKEQNYSLIRNERVSRGEMVKLRTISQNST